MCYIYWFLPHTACGTVSGRRYSCQKQSICPAFTATEPTFRNARSPKADITGLLHEYECATYILLYVYCSLPHTVCGQSPVIDEHRGRCDNESSALASQTGTLEKSVGHQQQQTPSQQQPVQRVCYVNVCYVIVVISHSVCGTVSGRHYSRPNQFFISVFTAIEYTFRSARNPATDSTGVLHEYECATYTLCYVYCSLSQRLFFQSPIVGSQSTSPACKGSSVMVSDMERTRKLAAAIMSSQVTLPIPNMDDRCAGCASEDCFSTASCTFASRLSRKAYDTNHCSACLMPLKRVGSVNMHPSYPGLQNCTFRNREVIRMYLVLASRGVDINVTLPSTFPTSGPEQLLAWLFMSHISGGPPNIVLFVAALLGLQH